MLMHTRPPHHRTIGRIDGRLHSVGWAWPVVSLVLTAVPVAGLVIAARLVERAADPTTTAWMVPSTIAVVALHAWLIAAIRFTVPSSLSPRRPVFPARRAIVCGCEFVALAGLLTIALVSGEPFRHLIRKFRFGASDLVDVGLLAAIIILFVTGGVMLLDAWDWRKAERSWPDHL